MKERRFCSNCGKELQEGSKFCSFCGSPVIQEESILREEQDVKKEIERIQEESNEKEPYENLPVVETDDMKNTEINAENPSKRYHGKKKPVLIIALICLILAGGIGFVLNNDSGSSNSDGVVASVKKKTHASPEDFVADAYESCVIGEIDADKLWEEYISDQSKELGIIEKDKFTADYEDVAAKGFEFVSYTNKGCEEIEDGIYKVTFSYKYKFDDSVDVEDAEEYVIQENGDYKILFQGIKSCSTYSSTSEDSKLYLNYFKVYDCVDGIKLNFEINNRFDRTVDLGWTDPTQITIKDSNGDSFTGTLDQHYILNASDTKALTCKLECDLENVSEFVIESVYITEENGFPSLTPVSYTYTLNTNSEDL